MEFEFDEAKSRTNLAKHGIDFTGAQQLWSGAVLALPARQKGEKRELAVGRVDGVFWTAILTRRAPGRIRLISVRRSRKEEIHAYHQSLEVEIDEDQPEKPVSEV
jgi:uncharacterized DUF497 family protein